MPQMQHVPNSTTCMIETHILDYIRGIEVCYIQSWQRNLANICRGITVFSIFVKIFEIFGHFRMTFFNVAFCKVDEFNGGFLRGCNTTDNIFVLKSLAQTDHDG